MSARTDLSAVSRAMHEFVHSRGWYAPSSPKPQTARNLASSVAIEAAELLELFQWSENADPERVADELADVFLYAVQLARVANVDLAEAVERKLERNQSRDWREGR